MRLQLIFPLLYVVLSAVLLAVFPGRHHLWQSYPWFCITLPASLIVLLTETMSGMVAALVAATLQYWAFGFYLDRRNQRGQRMRLAAILPGLYLLLCV